MLVAALIAKNEEEWLERCVASLTDLVDAVVVCDTGSEDGTAALAARLGCHVVHHVWQDDFAAARNVALDAALKLGATWILSVDADEEITACDPKQVRQALAAAPVDLYAVRLWNYQGPLASPRRKPAPALVPRLFRASVMRWQGKLHEHPRPLLNPSRRSAAAWNLFEIEHWGYCEEFLVRKRERNLAIAKAAWDETGGAVERFELARSLSFAKHTDEAREHFRVLVADRSSWKQLTPLRVRGSLGWLAVDALKDGESETALELANQAFAVEGPKGPPSLLIAQALAALERDKEAYAALSQVEDVADGYMLYDKDALFALRCVLAARCGDISGVLHDFQRLALEFPSSEHTHSAFVELAVRHTATAGVALLTIAPRAVWLGPLVALPASQADELAEAAWGVDGAHRMPLLAWSRRAASQLPIERVLLWSRRLAAAGAAAQTPAHEVAVDPVRPIADRLAAQAFVDSLTP